MSSLLIRNAQLVNRGRIQAADLLVQKGRIVKISCRHCWREHATTANKI